MNMNIQNASSNSTISMPGVIVMIVALLTISGCAANMFGMNNDEQQGSGVYTSIHKNAIMEYRIGPADVLSISVWNHKEMDQTVTVRPDGHISFPLTGDVQAVGLTPKELQNEMEKALGKYIAIIPGEVSVVVDAVHSYKVSVLGEVRLPGQFEFQSQATVLDALAEAGGLTEFASSSNIQILRMNGGTLEKNRFDYQKLIKADGSAARILVFPGDVILVP
jgi:polysaccharide export outer membrane protein